MPRPSYANVTSTLALVVALGGTSVAAAPLITGPRHPHRQGRQERLAERARRQGPVADPAGLPGSVRGPRGPAGAPGTAGTRRCAGRVLPIADVGANPHPVSYLVAELGTFTKQDAATRVDLHYATDLDPEDGCRVAAAGRRRDLGRRTGLAAPRSPRPVTSATGTAPSRRWSWRRSSGLGAGVHTVSIAPPPSAATSCNINVSRLAREVVVDEVAVLP